MTEVWRDIPDYEGRYQVSDMGKIRSLDREEPYNRWKNGGLRTIKGRVRKQTWGGPPKSKYLGFSVKSGDGRVHFLKTHLCVLNAFTGDRPSAKHDGCHCDGDRSNNELTNLRWDTKSANNQDKKLHGTSQEGEKNPSSKLTESDVLSIKAQLSKRTLKSLADEFEVSTTAIFYIKTNKNWSKS
jgi:hypothetical protein